MQDTPETGGILILVAVAAVMIAVLTRKGKKSRLQPGRPTPPPSIDVETWSASKLAFLNFLAAIVYAAIAYTFVNPAMAQACDPAREWWVGLGIVLCVNVMIALILAFLIFPKALRFAGREMKAVRGGGWGICDFVMAGFMLYQAILILDC